MRKLLLILLAAAVSVQFGLAQPPGGGRGGRGGRGGGANPFGGPTTPPPPPPAGLECVASTPMPTFPMQALTEKVDGSIWLDIQVTPEGTAGAIKPTVASAYKDADKLLTPAAEALAKETKFKPECNGKTVLMVFRYALHGLPAAKPEVTTRQETPYLIWIESQPMGK